METENITIVYCPTEEMLADFFTKPLQGALFQKFRRVLMGHAHVNTLSLSSSTPTEERVGEKRENETAGNNEEDTVVATNTTNAKTGGIGSLGSDITSTTLDENWITVRTRQVRTQGDAREPLNVETEKPMGNKTAKKDKRSSHSIV